MPQSRPPGVATLRGTVLGADHARAARALVAITPGVETPLPGGVDDRVETRTVETDDRGEFAVGSLALGTHRVRATVQPGRTARAFVLLTGNGDLDRVLLVCDTRSQVQCTVCVVDSASRPVAGAEVRILENAAADAPASRPLGRTDAGGALTFPSSEGVVAVMAQAEGVVGVSRAFVSGTENDLRIAVHLATPGCLRCLVPATARDVRLLAALSPMGAVPGPNPAVYASRQDGTEVWFRDIPPGRYSVKLAAPAAAVLLDPRRAPSAQQVRPGAIVPPASWPPEPLAVLVAPGATTTLDVSLAPGSWLDGFVRWRDDGRPAAGVKVRCRPVATPRDARAPFRIAVNDAAAADEGESVLVATTGEDGSYRLQGLVAGFYEVAVAEPSCSRSTIRTQVPTASVLEHRVTVPGMLAGWAPRFSTVRLSAATGDSWTWPGSGTFSVSCLAAGPYTIELAEAGAGEAGTVLPGTRTDLLIEAGRVTICNLRERARWLEGLVRWRGAPVVGARVTFDGEDTLTDTEGVFRLALLRASQTAFSITWGGVQQIVRRGVELGRPMVFDLPDTRLVIGVVDEAGGPCPSILSVLAEAPLRLHETHALRSGLVLEGVPRGRYVVSASTADGCQMMGEVHLDQDGILRLEKPAVSDLTVYVTDGAGTGVARAEVRIRSQRSSRTTLFPERSGATDAEGRFRLQGVPVGSVEIAVGKAAQVARETFVIRAGAEATVHVSLD